MVDRVQLQQIINYVVEREKKGAQNRPTEDKEVEVTLSQVAKDKTPVNYDDIEKKVKEIKQQMVKGVYQVDPEKILKGIEKYLSLG